MSLWADSMDESLETKPVSCLVAMTDQPLAC